MYGLLWFAWLSCPRSDWQPGGKTFFFPFVCVAPLDLKGLYVTTGRGGNTSERRRSGAGQFRRAERRGAVRDRRVPHPSTSRRNAHQQTLMAAWEITIHPPSPFFLFLWDFWLLVLSWPEVVASLISCSKLKSESTCRGRLWRSWIPI